jgi:peptide/nickel transport system permease protein
MTVLRFLGKLVAIGLVILLCVTFTVYVLLAYAIDPLSELMTYNGPDKQFRIESRIRELDLNTPPVIRYFKWLAGVAGYLIGRGTLGISIQNNQPITNELGGAFLTTMSLVLVAILLAILFGVAVGMLTAIRQYSTFDYLITFVSFFLYSLPAFWVAILLKQYGALGFNDFLRDPSVSLPAILILALAIAVLVFIVSASGYKKRALYAGFSFLFTGGLLFFCSATGWFAHPGLTVVGVGFLGIAVAFGLTYLSFGSNKSQYVTPGIVSAVMIALYFAIQWGFYYSTSNWVVLGLAIAVVGIGIAIGYFRGGDDRMTQARNGGLIGLIFFVLFYIDRLMRAFQPYMKNPLINNRPISTTGSVTPNLHASFLVMSMDSFTHIILPTLTLLLISFAGYTRYTRASMLDVLNADYIRTARAKGLPERTVIMRHAFKNALIPLATVIPLDIASILGGAIITETIFGWRGLGVLFQRSLMYSDFNGVIGVLLVTASMTIAANIVADLLYVVLDPRIRLEQ